MQKIYLFFNGHRQTYILQYIIVGVCVWNHIPIFPGVCLRFQRVSLARTDSPVVVERVKKLVILFMIISTVQFVI
jgi:hypothetical protein